MNKKTDYLIQFLKIIISLSLIAYLLAKNDWRNIINKINSIDVTYFVYASVLIVIVCPFLLSLRWKILLESEKNITLSDTIKLTYAGLFFNLVFPGSVGGDTIKIALFYKMTKNSALAASSVVLDRIIGLIALTILSAISSCIYYKITSDFSFSLESGGFLVLLIIFLGLISLSFVQEKFLSLFRWLKFKKLEDFTKKSFEFICWFKSHPKILLSTILLSLIAQIVGVFATYFTGISLGVKASLGYYFLFYPMIGLITSIPVSISGIGVREGCFAYFFAKAGVPEFESISLSLISFFISVLAGILGGIIYSVSSYEGKVLKEVNRET